MSNDIKRLKNSLLELDMDTTVETVKSIVKGEDFERIDDAVKKAIKDAANGGGYILSQSHTHASVDPTRLEWMIEAAHKYGKYPISI